MTVAERLNIWLLGNDTGASSKAIATYLSSGITRPIMSRPMDGWDLGRCIRLLDLIPEFRLMFPAMKQVHPQWAILVEHWAELEALYAEDLPTGKMVKSTERIQELLWGKD